MDLKNVLGVCQKTALLFVLAGFILPPSIHSEETTPPVLFPIENKGTLPLIDYVAFGEFDKAGTADYRYLVMDRQGLSEAAGTGVYPNIRGVLDQARYKELKDAGELDKPLSEYNIDLQPEKTFYRWAMERADNQEGLKYFNMARALEIGGHHDLALKGYYSVVVHFPRDVVWQQGQPWYVGPAALDAVYSLLERHPEWGVGLQDPYIRIENGFDRKSTNDKFLIHPGSWVHGMRLNDRMGDLIGFNQTLGKGKVRLVERRNGHWQLFIGDDPFMVRGMCYSPTPVGGSPDFGYQPHRDWMYEDDDDNGVVDSPYDSWVDANRNNIRDDGENTMGDFQLMKEMGVNTVRLYHHGENKRILVDLYENYGIRVAMGDMLGAYTIGSGADWNQGTDYTNPDHQASMIESVKRMVMKHKDEDYILFWMLGNENNYGRGSNADRNPRAYYKFANRVAELIQKWDPNHPVVLVNGDIEYLDILAEEGKSIPVLGVNVYRGDKGMGETFWREIHRIWKKPVLITEFGAPAYSASVDRKVAEHQQARYLLNNWHDIEYHAAGYRTGNAIGGFIFEWLDEWWKAGPEYSASVQDTVPQRTGPFYGGQMYEEFLGITSFGNGNQSPLIRQLRPAYHEFKNGPWKSDLFFTTRSSKKVKVR